MPPQQEKEDLRKIVLVRRDVLAEAERESKSRVIAEAVNALPEIRRASVILAYASFRSEVETYAMMNRWIAEGKRVAVPIPEKKGATLILSEVRNIPDDLVPGAYGVPEPRADRWRIIDLPSVEAVLVPGVVFDLSGHRIGYGKGYYDRFLEAASGRFPFIGPAFDCQVVERIPPEEHDRRVDILVTETRVLRPSAKGSERGRYGS